MNALSLPVGKQHDITSERIEMQKGLTCRIKIIAVTFMNMNRKKQKPRKNVNFLVMLAT